MCNTIDIKIFGDGKLSFFQQDNYFVVEFFSYDNLASVFSEIFSSKEKAQKYFDTFRK